MRRQAAIGLENRTETGSCNRHLTEVNRVNIECYGPPYGPCVLLGCLKVTQADRKYRLSQPALLFGQVIRFEARERASYGHRAWYVS